MVVVTNSCVDSEARRINGVDLRLLHYSVPRLEPWKYWLRLHKLSNRGSNFGLKENEFNDEQTENL